MCGIAGFFGRGDRSDLDAMLAELVHRGPDERGSWSDPHRNVYLGHRRLTILDAEGGRQPMWTADASLGVVFNGEIYNFAGLRAELEALGHRFRSDHSDTEVLLHGYRQWGDALTERLNGMWAFALLDRADRKLLLSRDRFGKKPLFYTHQNGTFAFASELKALVQHSAVAANLSPRSLQKYFAYAYIPAPGSLYEKIYKLPGGHNLSISLDDPAPRIKQYWDLKLEPEEPAGKNPEAEYCEQIDELLARAVQRRMVADVPLGFFLSGGIDSSAVTAYATRFSSRVEAIAIGFEEPSFDESRYARMLADRLGVKLHLRILSLEKGRRLLPEIAGRLDEPVGDSSILSSYLLCGEARRRVTVALGGDGGDELFAGYDPFRALRLARWYRRLVPRPVHHAIQWAVSLLPCSHRYMSLDFKLKRTLRGLGFAAPLWNPVWMGPLEPRELGRLFQQPIDLEDLYSEAIECWDSAPGSDLVDKSLAFYAKLYLQDQVLVKLDRASMLHSLEVRSPFLDIELVDFVRRIPNRFKIRRGTTKYILKKTLRRHLPATIIGRRKKGFGTPVGRWLREGELDCRQLDVGLPSFREFLGDRYRSHLQGRLDDRLYLFNHWLLSQYLDSNANRRRRAA